jgi:AcrR family transcriptional regulator
MTKDLETRERLLKTATVLFADRGFKKVTVREICRASRANVAAVNYHFGDKAGLYREVMKSAIQAMRETNELSQRAGEGESPEDQIRAFVRIFVQRLNGSGPSAWIHKLMARELDEPSEALDLVMRQVIQPRIEYLSRIAGAVMGLPPTDPRVLRAISSLQGQCLLFSRPVPAPMAKVWGTLDLDDVIHHIAEFSLAGMKALAAEQPAEAETPPRR